MLAVVKKRFPYSPDGLRVVELEEGDCRDIADGVFHGLEKAGFIQRAEAAAPVVETAPNSSAANHSPPSGAPVVRHMGRGKYAIFRDGVRLTPEAMTKDAADAALAGMLGA